MTALLEDHAGGAGETARSSQQDRPAGEPRSRPQPGAYAGNPVVVARFVLEYCRPDPDRPAALRAVDPAVIHGDQLVLCPPSPLSAVRRVLRRLDLPARQLRAGRPTRQAFKPSAGGDSWDAQRDSGQDAAWPPAGEQATGAVRLSDHPWILGPSARPDLDGADALVPLVELEGLTLDEVKEALDQLRGVPPRPASDNLPFLTAAELDDWITASGRQASGFRFDPSLRKGDA